MDNFPNPKPKYDLEERTFEFAKYVRRFIKTLPEEIANIEDQKQLIGISGSVGVNYIEANEPLEKRFFHWIKDLQERSKREC